MYCQRCGAPLKTQFIDERERLACSGPDCAFVAWENPVPVAAAIVELNGHVVLAQNRAWPEGVMSVITGYLEKAESPDDCVVREVKEELNLDVVSHEFIGHYMFAEKNQLLLAYAVTAQGRIQLGDELVAYKLIANDRLRAWDFGAGPAVKDWLLRRWRSRDTNPN